MQRWGDAEVRKVESDVSHQPEKRSVRSPLYHLPFLQEFANSLGGLLDNPSSEGVSPIYPNVYIGFLQSCRILIKQERADFPGRM